MKKIPNANEQPVIKPLSETKGNPTKAILSVFLGGAIIFAVGVVVGVMFFPQEVETKQEDAILTEEALPLNMQDKTPAEKPEKEDMQINETCIKTSYGFCIEVTDGWTLTEYQFEDFMIVALEKEGLLSASFVLSERGFGYYSTSACVTCNEPLDESPIEEKFVITILGEDYSEPIYHSENKDTGYERFMVDSFTINTPTPVVFQSKVDTLDELVEVANMLGTIKLTN